MEKGGLKKQLLLMKTTPTMYKIKKILFGYVVSEPNQPTIRGLIYY